MRATSEDEFCFSIECFLRHVEIQFEFELVCCSIVIVLSVLCEFNGPALRDELQSLWTAPRTARPRASALAQSHSPCDSPSSDTPLCTSSGIRSVINLHTALSARFRRILQEHRFNCSIIFQFVLELKIKLHFIESP